MPDFNINILMAVALALFCLYLVARILYLPVRLLARACVHFAGGVVILLLFNLIAYSVWGFFIGVNIFSGLVVGFMGIPGLVMLVILKAIL